MTVAQIRKISKLVNGYRQDAEVNLHEHAGHIAFTIYNLTHLVDPNGGHATFAKSGKLLESEDADVR